MCGGAFGIKGSWGNPFWDKEVGCGAASELLLELAPRKSLQNSQSTRTRGWGWGGAVLGECAKGRVEETSLFCQATEVEGIFPSTPHQAQVEA